MMKERDWRGHGLLVAVLLNLWLMPGAALAQEAEGSAVSKAKEEMDFAAKLLARGYYDLLELQYKEWLADETKLSPSERIWKTQGLIALYTALAERSAEQRDRKRYQELALAQIERLKKQDIPVERKLRLDLDENQLRLDEARTMGPVPPPVVNEEGEVKPSAVEQLWEKILAQYAKIGKEASAALEALLKSKKTGSEAAAKQIALEGILLESGLRGAWARYYYSLALPGKDERRAKLLKNAIGTFEMTATSYPDKDLQAECYLGCALCTKELGQKDKALELLDTVTKGGSNQAAIRTAYYNKALILFDAKQYEKALNAADSALKVVTRIPDVDLERATLLLKAKAGFALAATLQGPSALRVRAEAEKAAMTVAAAGGKWAPMAQELLISAGTTSAGGASFESLLKADKLYESQKWAEAAAAYEQFLTQKPEGASKVLLADAQLKLGFCYYRLQSFAKAAEAFKAVMDTSPDPSRAARAAYYMAVAYGLAAAQSNKEEDRTAYVNALMLVEKRYPNHEEISNIAFRLAAMLESSAKYAEAAQKYRQVREGAKDYREAQLRAGICDFMQLAEMWKTNAPESQTKPLLTSCVASLRAAAAPVAEGDEAGRRIASDATLRMARLYLSANVQKPQEALNVLKDFAKKFPDNQELIADALFLEFWAYQKLGKLEEAHTALRAAAEKSPTNPQIPAALEALAIDYDDAADKAKGPEAKELRDKAVALLDAYIAQLGNSANQLGYERLLLRRAAAYAKLGRWDKALPDYEILYKRYPGAKNINKELARAYSETGKYADALKIYQDLEDGTERYSPDWWEARYNKALMFYKMGETDNTIRAIESVRILREDLGGPEWKAKFEELLKKAQKK